jgi:hypothetical protein
MSSSDKPELCRAGQQAAKEIIDKKIDRKITAAFRTFSPRSFGRKNKGAGICRRLSINFL